MSEFSELGGIPIGAFELSHIIGQGAMGDVWLGRHRGQGVPIALKVITSELAQTAHYLSAFRNEVQSVARLEHPGIVMVFEHGRIPAQAEERSRGRLVAGSPFLAMEYANLGSLDALPKSLPWMLLRAVMVALLDALSHAHARGVVHRDLKPDNVLLCGPDQLRPGLKLTDFGLARALDDESVTGSIERIAGTPLYMAPEQCQGMWRDYGAWSDLYSFGCMVWELVTGKPPFVAASAGEILTAHVFAEPPPLRAQQQLPSGFEQWLLALLEKEPRDRFRRAADAAWALAKLGNPEGTAQPAANRHLTHGLEATAVSAGETRDFGLELDTLDLPAVGAVGSPVSTQRASSEIRAGWTAQLSQVGSSQWALAARSALLSDHRWSVPWLDFRVPELPKASGQRFQHQTPPLPVEWQEAGVERPSFSLVGTGIGLFDLRTVPLVGRVRERDALWNALCKVSEHGQLEVVVVHGEAGIGKTRLARWVCERAHELGAATPLQASHSPNGGPADGLGAMLGRFLRCLGLTRNETLRRLAELTRAWGETDAYEWNALTEAVSPASLASAAEAVRQSQVINFANPFERYVVVRRVLERLAAQRPLVLHIDDAQWAADALGFVAFLLKTAVSSPLPILVVVCARNDAFTDRPIEAQLLASIEARPAVRTLKVKPLAASENEELVTKLLGLEGELAAQVQKRSEGVPLFAVQLVADWVSRGVLEAAETGFVLKAGEEANVPDDIHALWATRLDRLVAETAQGEDAAARPGAVLMALRSLYLAAILGQHVDDIEWRCACAAAGLKLPPTLLQRMAVSGLVHGIGQGWTFDHGMLRESLERRAREEAVFEPLHRKCAQALSDLYPPGTPLLNERVGRHLAAADDGDDALGPLLQAALERKDRSEFAAARGLLDERERLLDQLAASALDRRRCEGWVTLAKVLLVEEDEIPRGHALAQRASEVARQCGYGDLLPEALLWLGHATQRQGQLAAAEIAFQQARRLFDDNQEPKGVATCLDRLANLALKAGDRERAVGLFKQSRLMWEMTQDSVGLASSLIRLASLARADGQLGKASGLAEQARVLFEGMGNQLGVAVALNASAEYARAQGDHEAAEQGYRAALSRYASIGSARAIFPRLNLSLLLLERDDFSRARVELDPLLPECRRRQQRVLMGSVCCLLSVAAAGEGDWSKYDAHVTEATNVLRLTGVHQKDDAWAMQRSAQLALSAGQTERAQRAGALAARLLEGLGRPDDANAIRALVTT